MEQSYLEILKMQINSVKQLKPKQKTPISIGMDKLFKTHGTILNSLKQGKRIARLTQIHNLLVFQILH